METTKMAKAATVGMKLEVILLGVSDVDRAKAFYENLGWRLDGDFASGDDFRALQMTPPNSGTSIIFGKGVTSSEPGSVDGLVLAVKDIDDARNDLIARGVNVSEVFHYAGGPLNNTGQNPRVAGRDPEGRSYFSFVSFEDPDGNGWLVQEISARLPGREWAQTENVASLAELLHETEQHHGDYESTHAEHHWWDWYPPYLNARQNGSSVEASSAAANRYMDENLHISRR